MQVIRATTLAQSVWRSCGESRTAGFSGASMAREDATGDPAGDIRIASAALRASVLFPAAVRFQELNLKSSQMSLICTLEFSTFRSEEHTSELQSLMRISYAVFCLKKKTNNNIITQPL